VAEPEPAAVAFHAERHAKFRRIVAALGTEIFAERTGALLEGTA
jgi:hypothetical protein